ncbi:AI-2E family transporter [Pseudaquabacterium terrae]|uniref:AI-2E family transporter n=1 Tax=Pseudaquabacterium terrae TaxID=2732868 RepID=UPI0031B643C4
MDDDTTHPSAAAISTEAQVETPARALMHMPVDVRSGALAVIALLLAIHTLHWAAALIIPLLLGLIFSYALSPAVDVLERWQLPRWLGAALVVVTVTGTLGWTTYALADDATELLESLPAAAQKLRQTLTADRSGRGTLDKVQEAAAQLEQAVDENAASGPVTKSKGVTQVQIVRAKFNIQEYLWTGTRGLVAFVGQSLAVCLLTYFLVASGSAFRRKMVRIAGPTFSEKRITIQALDEITEQIQRYLLVQLLLSALVGVATWLAFLWLGLDHAGVWGIAAAVLNLVPYIGSLVVTVGAALVALMQFGTLEMALAIAGVSLGIHVVSGYLLTPWLTSRTSQLGPVAVFIGVLAWGWLWGVWGMLLGVPILMIVKAACDRVDSLKPVGELLGT